MTTLLLILIGALIVLATVAIWGCCWLGAERDRRMAAELKNNKYVNK